MSETRKLLERQGAWQKKRAALTWSEKIRMAEAVRESAARLTRPRPAITTPNQQGAFPSPPSSLSARKNSAKR